ATIPCGYAEIPGTKDHTLGTQPGHAPRRDRARCLLLSRGSSGQHRDQQRGPRRLQRATSGDHPAGQRGDERNGPRGQDPQADRPLDEPHRERRDPLHYGRRRGQAQGVRRHPPRRHRLPLAERGERLHRRPPPRLPQHRELANLLGHEQGRRGRRGLRHRRRRHGVHLQGLQGVYRRPLRHLRHHHRTRKKHPHPPDLHVAGLLPASDHPGRAHGHLRESGV
ncbi:MAG: Sortase (surface protein transpeptidase), partial [uncultured Rubrobacteraceae bacterium]